MAKSASEGAKLSNGYDPDLVKSYTDRIFNLDDEIATEKSKYMNAVKNIREDINSVFQEAKKDGLPLKAMKSVVKSIKLERKVAKARDDLDPEIQDEFDLLKVALGDYASTPLGGAALAAAA